MRTKISLDGVDVKKAVYMAKAAKFVQIADIRLYDPNDPNDSKNYLYLGMELGQVELTVFSGYFTPQETEGVLKLLAYEGVEVEDTRDNVDSRVIKPAQTLSEVTQ